MVAKLSTKWLFCINFAGVRPTYLRKLHARYGPVVRIAPNELSFASAAAAHDIYVGATFPLDSAPCPASTTRTPTTTTTAATAVTGTTAPLSTAAATHAMHEKKMTRTFPKSPLYAAVGRPALFNMRDEAEHRERLKRIGHCYAPSLLRDAEALMRGEIALLLAALDDRGGGAGLNVLHWFRMMAFDIIGEAAVITTHAEKASTFFHPNPPTPPP
jgi:hypothetical protein